MPGLTKPVALVARDPNGWAAMVLGAGKKRRTHLTDCTLAQLLVSIEARYQDVLLVLAEEDIQSRPGDPNQLH